MGWVLANCLRMHCTPTGPDATQEYTLVVSPEGFVQSLRLLSSEPQLKPTNMGGFCTVVVVEKVYLPVNRFTHLYHETFQNSGWRSLSLIAIEHIVYCLTLSD